MLLLAGTLPIKELNLHAGKARLSDDNIIIGDMSFPINRGSAAMMASCCAVCNMYDLESPYCVVSGDIGRGNGSEPLYHYLRDKIPQMGVKIAVFHYIMPNLNYHNEVLNAIKTMKEKPVLIADAGYMYVAKMAGFAGYYDMFTPDLGELAFLADNEAPHPFYTRGFIIHMEEKAKELIKMAYDGNNAAKFMCIKGTTDYICKDGEILKEVSQPSVPELEPIGGTGDTITGMIAAFINKGMTLEDAAVSSVITNRFAGQIAKPNPATQIWEIIKSIPLALNEIKQ